MVIIDYDDHSISATYAIVQYRPSLCEPHQQVNMTNWKYLDPYVGFQPYSLEQQSCRISLD